MELKLNIISIIERSIISFNQTRMELKLHPGRLRGVMRMKLLIRPEWNWNTPILPSCSTDKVAFNQTRMELKQHGG